jgi:hypothetical protein
VHERSVCDGEGGDDRPCRRLEVIGTDTEQIDDVAGNPERTGGDEAALGLDQRAAVDERAA